MADAQYGVPSSDDNASSGLVAERKKKPVWGKISNGANDVAYAVMGGSVSWPSLTESIKASMKASTEGLTSTLGHMNSPPTKRKPIKCAGGGNCDDGVGTSGSFSSSGSPSSSSSSIPKISQYNVNHPTKSNYNNRDGIPRESHGRVDQMDQKGRLGNSRRGYHGNRHDRDHGVHERSSSRTWSGRNFHMQRGHLRQPAMQPPMPPAVPFFTPPPLQHFSSSVAFPGYYFPTHPHPQAFGGFPFGPRTIIPPIHRPVFITSNHQNHISLLKQIEYYFSVENLCKDEYLRKNMDEHGWVSVFLIAGFKRVQLLTDNIQFILDVLRSSEVVEVQGNRIRRRNEWSKWILNPHQCQSNTESEAPSTTTNQQSMVSLMESVALGDNVEGSGDSSPLDLLDRADRYENPAPSNS